MTLYSLFGCSGYTGTERDMLVHIAEHIGARSVHTLGEPLYVHLKNTFKHHFVAYLSVFTV